MTKLEQLKTQGTDRQKVKAWLDSIGAPKDEAEEVLELCTKDIEARKYYVKRSNELESLV